MRDALECGWSNEFCGILGEDDIDHSAHLREFACDRGRFECGDASRDAEDDAFVFE